MDGGQGFKMTEYTVSRSIRVRENVDDDWRWLTHYVNISIRSEDRGAFLLVDALIDDNKEMKLNESHC
jgi:hypothetical protein